MIKDLEKFETNLRSRGLRVTRTRELIFREIFSRRAAHLNAEDIHRRLRARREDVSLATVYRTVNLLVKSGLVRAVDLGEDHSHFEPENLTEAHGHLICLSCGRVQEFSHAGIQNSIERIGREKGFELEKFSLQVFGFCEHCGKK